MSREQPSVERRSAAEVARRFVEAYNAAAAAEDPGPILAAVATPTAVAGYLVESQSGVVAPLASRTAVPPSARLEINPGQAQAPFPDLIVVPFTGHGFPREDFTGEAELHLENDLVTKVVFRAP